MSKSLANAARFIAGDIESNIGTFVKAILNKPEKSLPAKYAFVYSDAMPFNKMLACWSEVTGRRATFLECSKEQYAEMWGLFGQELGQQWKALEAQPDWTAPYQGEVVTADDLGIKSGDLVNLKAALMKDKDKL